MCFRVDMAIAWHGLGCSRVMDGFHGVARVKEMEMAHCIPYALGAP